MSWIRRYGGWVLLGVLALAFFLRFGGTTVMVLNRAYRPICGVYVSTTPDARGPNRILTPIPSPQSRDVHLPFLMNRFVPRAQRAWYVWATDCEGMDLDAESFTGSSGALLFVVNR